MSAPNPPSDFLKTIPSVSAAFCGRFLSFFSFPRLFADYYAHIRDEQGDISPQFCAEINACVAGATTGGGTGGGTAGTLNTPVVSATDGTFTDRIVVSWNAITPLVGATRYEIWRGDSKDVSLAHKIADVNSTTTFTDDGSKPTFPLVSGRIYFYFIRAFDDGSNSSSYSQGDTGYEGTLITTLPGVTDLVASKGFSPYASHGKDPATGKNQFDGNIYLRWTNAAGAQTYDIYRNTTDDYTTATRIKQDATFKPPTMVQGDYAFDPIKNNGADLAYSTAIISIGETDNAVAQNYYFWVVPKKTNPSAIGPFSNSNAGALGWAAGQGQGIIPNTVKTALISGGASVSVPAAVTKAWVIVFGSSASGAGGNQDFGGGGGGIGAIVTGLLSVASAGKLRLVSSPEADPAGGIHDANGNDGPTTTLQYSPLGTFADTVNVVVCAAPSKGLFNALGGGLGGVGASATVDPSLSPSNIYDGKAGGPAVTTTGGDSGYQFGFGKGPGEVWEGVIFGGDAQAGHAGGGAYNFLTSPLLATGGLGRRGAAFLVWY